MVTDVEKFEQKKLIDEALQICISHLVSLIKDINALFLKLPEDLKGTLNLSSKKLPIATFLIDNYQGNEATAFGFPFFNPTTTLDNLGNFKYKAGNSYSTTSSSTASTAVRDIEIFNEIGSQIKQKIIAYRAFTDVQTELVSIQGVFDQNSANKSHPINIIKNARRVVSAANEACSEEERRPLQQILAILEGLGHLLTFGAAFLTLGVVSKITKGRFCWWVSKNEHELDRITNRLGKIAPPEPVITKGRFCFWESEDEETSNRISKWVDEIASPEPEPEPEPAPKNSK